MNLVLVDKDLIFIMKSLNRFHLDLIKNKGASEMLKTLDVDFNLINSLTTDDLSILICKGVIIVGEVSKIPLHLYPLCLSFIALPHESKAVILAYLHFYHQFYNSLT